MIFLGCDGGSTKTEWLLVDHTGQVLAHRIFPGCNFAFWGEDGFRDLMVRSVQTLLADSGITSQQITSAMLSLTVYGEVPGTEEFFPQVMQSILPDCPLQFSNDSVAGWCGSLAKPTRHQHCSRHRFCRLWPRSGRKRLSRRRLVSVFCR